MAAAARRRDRNSSSESSGGASSDEEDVLSTPLDRSTIGKSVELTLKDDEDTISFQPPLPEEYGKKYLHLKDF